MEIGLLWFIIVGTVGTVALAGVSFTKWRWWWRGVVAFVVTAVFVMYITPGGPPTLGADESWWNTSPAKELLLFGSMLLGMAARVLSVAIEHRKSNPGEGLAVDRWDFVYPMLFAVPTFGAVLSQARTEAVGVVEFVLAFQTGFFWQTILKKGELG
jgi:hypothetical protein